MWDTCGRPRNTLEMAFHHFTFPPPLQNPSCHLPSTKAQPPTASARPSIHYPQSNQVTQEKSRIQIAYKGVCAHRPGGNDIAAISEPVQPRQRCANVRAGSHPETSVDAAEHGHTIESRFCGHDCLHQEMLKILFFNFFNFF